MNARANRGTEIAMDKQSRALVDRLAGDPFLGPHLAPAEMRRKFGELYAEIGPTFVDVAQVQDREVTGPIGSLAVRIYHPKTDERALLPICLFFHGGGMVVGDIESYDTLCRHLCVRSKVIIVSASYRRSPEHKYPAAVDDAYAAFEWVHAHAETFGGDPKAIAVGGESGGGYLAAVVSQLARTRNGPKISFQLLIYPALGTRFSSYSLRHFAVGFGFDASGLDWIYSQYLNENAVMEDPAVSPIMASDFSNLPDAHILTAGFDILRDDAELYGALLQHGGSTVEINRVEGTIHGFVLMAGVIDKGVAAIHECANALRRGLATKVSDASD